ncbi:MAG: hypothetical protein ABI548_02815 [Polyangiaceae bacterium]
MLTRFFVVVDRVVAAPLTWLDAVTAAREIWNGTPLHLRGRVLPPVPTPARW